MPVDMMLLVALCVTVRTCASGRTGVQPEATTSSTLSRATGIAAHPAAQTMNAKRP